MDSEQELENAIVLSIVEQSFDKIYEYFEGSSFRAKSLNAKTLSILLSLLEKDGSKEEQTKNVECVLYCLNKLLMLKQNPASWEHLAENLSKIFELCFCKSVELKHEELIQLIINLLDKIILVNSSLTNHIFEYLLDPCLTALCVYCKSSDYTLLYSLSSFTASLCQKSSRTKRREVVPTVLHLLDMLSNLIGFCGDYEIQASIVEVLSRCKLSIVQSMSSCGDSEELKLFSCSEKLCEEFNKYSFINFDPDCRMFLNALNENLGDKRQVYSVPCICLVYNGNNLMKPKDPGYKSFWVDFNIARQRISIYHELSESNNWDVECILFEEVHNVVSKDSICITKHANKNIDSVKVELSLVERSQKRLGFLKIYCRKTQFFLLHRVLNIVFHNIYKCEVDLDSSADIGLPSNLPLKLSSPTPIKESSNPVETNISDSPRCASKFDNLELQLSKQNVQQKTLHCTSPTEEQKHEGETSTKSNINVCVEVHSNFPQNGADIIEECGTFGQNYCKSRPREVFNMKDKNCSVLVSNSIQKSPKIPSFIHLSSLKNEINDSSMFSANNKSLNTQECAVKRKRLYSIENEDACVKSIVLSSQDEQQPGSEKASVKEKLIGKEKDPEKDCFLNKIVKRRKVSTQNNRFKLFADGNSSDDSIPCHHPETTFTFSKEESHESLSRDEPMYSSERDENNLQPLNITPKSHKTSISPKLSYRWAEGLFSDDSTFLKSSPKRNRKRNTYAQRNKKGRKKFSSPSFPSSSDSDYKPPAHNKETVCKVPDKRILRPRIKGLSNVRVVDKTNSNKNKRITSGNSTCLMENNKDSTVPRKIKKNKSVLGSHQSATLNLNTTPYSHHLQTSCRNESHYTSKRRSSENQDFLNSVVLSRVIDPTRDETLSNEIEMNAIQPEDPEISPQKKTLEAQCEIEDQVIVPSNLDLTVSKELTVCDELLERNRKWKSKRLGSGKPMNSLNTKVDEMSIDIHNESSCHDMSLIQSTFKVEDIVEFSQKSVLNLKNNINATLLQSEEKRHQHLSDFDFKLQTTRHSLLEHCKSLEVNSSKLNKLKVLLDETYLEQQNIIIKIQNEMANIEAAKDHLFQLENDVANSETFSIMNIFKSIGTYVRRLLFTSLRESAIES